MRNTNYKYKSLFLLSVVLVAFVLRLAGFVFWIDIPGDGPTRAIAAHYWSKSPHIQTGGVWLPGFMYLAGTLALVVDNPLISARILNLILGTLTIPLVYFSVCGLYGSTTAFLSASMLALLPLHIGLSASSLAEASFSFEIIAGTLFLITASERKKTAAVYLSLSLLCLGLAVMTRYEAWVLIPLFPSYYFRKTRSIATTAFIMIALVGFPLSWVTTNYFHTGTFVYGFTAPELSPSWTEPVDLIQAGNIIASKSVSHLGWVALIAIICGGLIQIGQSVKRKIGVEQCLYVSMILLFWTFILYFTMGRGKGLQDRYLLLGFILILPFAAIPLTYSFSRQRRWLVSIACIVLVASVGFLNLFHRRHMYVTRTQPLEIRKVAEWLKASPYRNDAILATQMAWQSSYLPLYFPEIGSRYFIVSSYTGHSQVEEFLRTQEPSLLITRDGDDQFRSPVESILGRKIRTDRPVYTANSIKLYLLGP